MTNVELYEALKGSIPDKAARMIAEVVPPAKDLATKHDIAALRGEIGELRTGLRGEIAELRAEVRALPTMRTMFGFFVPVWLGAWGTVVAVILKG